MSSKQIDWDDGSGEKIIISASSFVGDETIEISSPENTRATLRSKTIVLRSVKNPAKEARVNITQEAAVAFISLSTSTLNFSQRADSGSVTVTCNSGWETNQNDNFEIPETLQISYNPHTDMVDLLDQPYSVYKKIQESEDYVIALTRIGAPQHGHFSRGSSGGIDRSLLITQKNAAGYRKRMGEFLQLKYQDKEYHRVIARSWFHNGIWSSNSNEGQAQLYKTAMVITKPGILTSIRSCELPDQRLKIFSGRHIYANVLDKNPLTGRITLKGNGYVNTLEDLAKISQPALSVQASTTQAGSIGYILLKRVSVGNSVNNWDEISNFTRVRYFSGSDYKLISEKGPILVVYYHFGD